MVMFALWWVGLGLGAIVLVAAVTFLWWFVPKWQMRSITASEPKARADIEDNFRKTVGQALGGAAVLAGAGIAYYGTQVSSQASHDLLISNQVAKGFEQLASHKMVMRLGGIYALESAMNGSAQYHRPILEALCAFIRESTKTHSGDGPPATDITAALEVIIRRAPGDWDVVLEYIRIPRVLLVDANLSRANLLAADLHSVWLINSDLSDTMLNSANLSGAVLIGANLANAVLGNANLKGAHLSNASPIARPEYGMDRSANLSYANLRGADLTGADLRRVHLRGADLTGADLTGADLSDAKLDGQAQLDGACGVGVKLPKDLSLKPCPEKPVAPAGNPE
jgi:hypothetical protein